MKANAIIWKHSFNMKTMKPMSSSVVKQVNLKFPSKLNQQLMKVAIVGQKSYEDYFKEHAFEDENRFSRSNEKSINDQVWEAVGNDLKQEACKVVLEFPEVGNLCYVLRDTFGKKSGSFDDHSTCDRFN